MWLQSLQRTQGVGTRVEVLYVLKHGFRYQLTNDHKSYDAHLSMWRCQLDIWIEDIKIVAKEAICRNMGNKSILDMMRTLFAL